MRFIEYFLQMSIAVSTNASIFISIKLPAIPSHAFDAYLSNAVFYDILFMWFGRQIFEDDTAYLRYPQTRDSFGYHIFAHHIFGEKSIVHTMIRDEIFRILQEGRLPWPIISWQIRQVSVLQIF